MRLSPYLKDKQFIVSTIIGIIFLMIGVVATYFAIVYANGSASLAVTDIILSNIPVFDVDGIFVYGPVVFFVLIGLYLIIFEPKKIPFTLKSVGLFLVIRSFFLTLTHIAPFPTHINITTTGLFSVFTTGNDLFFSSHTGLPFLFALIFWNNKPVRYLCIFDSIFFGTIVLMAHLHYSIDVFAAFFITYAIYKIAARLFKSDLQEVKNIL